MLPSLASVLAAQGPLPNPSVVDAYKPLVPNLEQQSFPSLSHMPEGKTWIMHPETHQCIPCDLVAVQPCERAGKIKLIIEASKSDWFPNAFAEEVMLPNGCASTFTFKASLPDKRTNYPPYVREILNETFQRDRHPSMQKKRQLAVWTNLSIQQINTWFSNKRRREKPHPKQDSPS